MVRKSTWHGIFRSETTQISLGGHRNSSPKKSLENCPKYFSQSTKNHLCCEVKFQERGGWLPPTRPPPPNKGGVYENPRITFIPVKPCLSSFRPHSGWRPSTRKQYFQNSFLIAWKSFLGLHFCCLFAFYRGALFIEVTFALPSLVSHHNPLLAPQVGKDIKR